MTEVEHEGLHVLAIVAHPDDAELLCGGVLLRSAARGYRTGILDLTRGESGSYGTEEIRRRESQRAAQVLGVEVRRSAELPDGALRNIPEYRTTVATLIRELRPRVVILQYDDERHPDHRIGSELARDACFVAGMKKAPADGESYRPHKILYGLSYREHAPHPSFVVDISEVMERKMEAIFAYESQLEGKTALGSIRGGGERSLREQIRAHHAHYGSWIRRPYGEPYLINEAIEVDDVVALRVNSM